jgi:hypothetical protein
MEAPIGFVEPAAGEELLRWRAERRRIADTPDRMHKLYRRAEGVEEHLQRVPVPEVEPMPIDELDTPGSQPEPQ